MRENEDSGRMIEIVEKMKAVATSNWSGMTLIDKVGGMSLPNEVKEQVISYLEETF